MQNAYDDIVKYIVENQEKFYRVAYSYMRNKEDALDVVQNAVCKALEHYDTLQNQKAVKTWFYRILVNESCTMLRKEKKETPLEDGMMDVLVYIESAYDKDQQVFEMVMQLPQTQKTVILLHYYEDMTLREIAEITSTNINTVKSRLYSALAKLKPFWKEAER